MRLPGYLTFSAALCAVLSAGAQPAEHTLEPIVVSATRAPESAFNVPAAMSVVTGETISQAGAQVNLSESLNRVPGLSAFNRQNYAQDLQMSIRGFGARSTFGIRGVRLIVDGIPATMPDGQGQASSITLGSVGRIEVLRGPLAQLYGNAAGGVVQVFTENDAKQPTVSLSAAAGPYHLTRLGLKYSTSTPDYGLTVDTSQFHTSGYRDHSGAQRGQLNARLRTHAGPNTDIGIVLNLMDQPRADDPGGLTRTEWDATPRRASTLSLTQNARKSVRQQQLGTVIDHRLSDTTSLTGRLYAGQRSLDNALSVPPVAQNSAKSSGGMVDFDRVYAGLGLQLNHRIILAPGRAVRLAGGVEIDDMRENRQGFVNVDGSRGMLKRDERNRVHNRDVFVQASTDLSTDWMLTGGLRHSEVRFISEDHFVTTGNPDDSGGVNYHATNPVLGLTWHTTPTLNLYANLGRGFETPTFTELAYRLTGTGLNSGLGASRSRHLEIGGKWRPGSSQRLEMALFDIDTRDEIVVESNLGGRSTFKNAGRTRRRGAEFAWTAGLADTLRSTLSLTAMRAYFVDGFTSGTGQVSAGNRLPGTAGRSAFAELVWTPRHAPGGFTTAAELVHTGRLYVNDLNEDYAPTATVLNLRAAWSQRIGPWQFSQLLRLDNATNRRYAGSVIVNAGNGQFFEPALPRGWSFVAAARHEF